MALEIISIIAVVLYMALMVERMLADRYVARRAVEEAAARARKAAADATPPATTRLAIPGARALPRTQHARVARFGVRPERVLELLVYSSGQHPDAWPIRMRNRLARMQDAGDVRGAGIGPLVLGEGPLPGGHGLYFALVDRAPEGPEDDAPQALAFVDVLP